MIQTHKSVTDWIFGVHKFLAKLHGMDIHDHEPASNIAPNDRLVAAYSEYAEAVARACAALQTFGVDSQQFRDADLAGMRLFHRVKKAQGLKMPGRTRS
jgi:hypothetical protein